MARVRPFRAYTFSHARPDITDLTAPPYDVISPEQRERLLARTLTTSSRSSCLKVHSTRTSPATATRPVPRAGPMARRGVLVRDEQPTYVLEQRYELGDREIAAGPSSPRSVSTFDAGIVLPHQAQRFKALGDRFNLIASERRQS